jgi:hypothetical protein
MIKPRHFIAALLPTVFFLFSTCFINDEITQQRDVDQPGWTVRIPPGGNSWVVNQPERNREVISESGIQNWSDPDSRIRTFFHLEKTGDLTLGLRLRAVDGPATIRCDFGGEVREVTVSGDGFEDLTIGSFRVVEAGYHWLELQGLQKTGAAFAEVEAVLLGGPAGRGEAHYVKDEFYWGRRGPSVHLWYELPAEASEVAWFYNEITVPEGEDVLGSYFMANGFGEGYFGFQVNSPAERRILFSVWSPYQTDNPNEIPEEYKIRLLKKGEDVYTGEFGNEGSGGQSYLRYNWRAGTTYRFLLRGEPAGGNATDYTAYFYAPEEGRWLLIAGWRRPKTDAYLKGLYSFLENFYTETGVIARRALYGAQWIYDTNGRWHELTRARFTADNTARKGNRLDFTGGVENGRFFLRNCGFFSERTAIDTPFERPATGIPPEVDLTKLP